VERQCRHKVFGEDVFGGLFVRSFDFDLKVQAPGTQDSWIDQILSVAGANNDDVL
jgi:hypothetical protein